MLKFIPKWLQRDKTPCQDDLARPFFAMAKQAILVNELPKAIAHLDSGIKVAPNQLKLYLHRAQILQYGMNNYSGALRDYRYILRALENQPDHTLASQCKQAMKDMMTTTT